MVDFILIDATNAYWPGILSYRSRGCKKGYPTQEAAELRARQVRDHAASRGLGSPDLRVLKRLPLVRGANRIAYPL